ncbi:MAG: 50S ribosomal protein L3, partial [Candidatus Omnitrophica bacterium]|nr:50S ribosomal protein L3 [Candidatus Omnitrophota bacterium]
LFRSKKIGVKPLKVIKEFKSTDNKEYKVGQEIKIDIFQPGDYVDVVGSSIGKGFQGGMKRHHWSGGPGGHGSNHHRRVGSIGASADPSKTVKGFPMPGHMGDERCTTQGLRVMEVDLEKNILVLKGAVPGSSNGYVMVKRSQKKAFRSLDEEKVFVKKKVNPMKQSKAKAKGKK